MDAEAIVQTIKQAMEQAMKRPARRPHEPEEAAEESAREGAEDARAVEGWLPRRHALSLALSLYGRAVARGRRAWAKRGRRPSTV